MQDINELLQFIEASPTAWHAVNYMTQKLEDKNFEFLDENSKWKLKPGQSYAVVRNGTTLCAFIAPATSLESAMIVGAHTDSPGLKLKPNAEYAKENMIMLGVEPYGGPLLTSWLNRDLGIAGRVVYKDARHKIKEKLVDFREHPVILPQLAIHLDKNVNESGLTLHKQDHLAVLAGLKLKSSKGYLETLLGIDSILAHDLYVFPLEKPRLAGIGGQFVSSYRIDNLASVYAGLSGLLRSQTSANTLKMAVFWDNEEIGSQTTQGAASPFLPQIIERICLCLNQTREDYFRVMRQGLCVSMDMTHALHPNYADKSEPRHPLLMDKGIAIKTSAQQRYATDSRTAVAVVDICQQHHIPYQFFVSRGDLSAGTTIGPIHAASTGMPTVDIGCPQLSMHSCRELFACEDYLHMCKLATNLFAK